MTRSRIGVVFAGALLALAGGVAATAPLSVAEQYAQARRFYADARYDEAFDAFNAVLASGESSLADGARRGRLQTAIRTWRFDLARQDAAALVGGSSADAEAWALQGDAFWVSGYFDEADAAYQRALARDSGWGRARFGVARSALTRGRYAEALEEASAAGTAEPRDPEVCMLVAEAYERQLRFDEAAATYRRCLPLIPKALRHVSDIAKSKIKVLQGFSGLVPVAIDDEASRPLHTVPFRLEQNKIILDGRLNGRPTELVLDTGAERTTLSYETANRTHVRILSETQLAGLGSSVVSKFALARADLLELGDLRLRHVPVVVRPEGYARVEADARESFSPMALGLSVGIDYQAHQVTLGRTLPDEGADVRLPMRTHFLPMVRGMLNDSQPAYFVVDTGGELISISQDTADQLAVSSRPHIRINVWGATGPDRTAFLLPGMSLDLGTIAFRDYPLAVLNLRAPSVLLGFRLGGILGHGFLGQYQVALDFQRGELRLRRPRQPG
jgi:tetratricopeptide (TPR) repeat protein